MATVSKRADFRHGDTEAQRIGEKKSGVRRKNQSRDREGAVVLESEPPFDRLRAMSEVEWRA